jgi:hypothetical protein
MATTSNDFDLYLMKEAHSLLEQCGFSRIYTGGGCSAWARFFPNAHIMVTQDATADLAPEYMSEIGISVGAFCDETDEQIYWETCHKYSMLPRLLLEGFAAAVDHRGGEDES